METYFNQALRIVGHAPMGSIDAILLDPNLCNILAQNATAFGIFEAHYKSQLSAYIDSNFNDSLNLLCFLSKAKAYLYRDGNQCTYITGGWYNTAYDDSAKHSWFEDTQIRMEGGWSEAYPSAFVCTNSTIDLKRFSTLYGTAIVTGVGVARLGARDVKTSDSNNDSGYIASLCAYWLNTSGNTETPATTKTISCASGGAVRYVGIWMKKNTESKGMKLQVQRVWVQ